MNTSDTPLKWKLLTKKRGGSTQGVPPGKEHLAWVTNTAVLIDGGRDAVLVDTFLSAQQSRELAELGAESGQKPGALYVNHVPGGHYFGPQILRHQLSHGK